MNYFTTDTDLTAVANAIRQKGGTTASLTYPNGFVSAISAIPTGGGGGGYEDEIIQRSISGTYINNTADLIGTGAFNGCSSLEGVNFGSCLKISANAFLNCPSLKTASFARCKNILQNAFSGCRSLTDAYFPSCSSIDKAAFKDCTSLQNISFPVMSIANQSAFMACTSLSIVDFPKCKTIGSQAFMGCTDLKTISFPMGSAISSQAFQKTGILSAYFLGSSIPTLTSTNVFSSTPIASGSGHIFVRESLYSSWIAASKWATYASAIVSMTDAEIEALG